MTGKILSYSRINAFSRAFIKMLDHLEAAQTLQQQLVDIISEFELPSIKS